MIQKQDLTAIILAGGKGSRMGHIDKGLIAINGQALISRIINEVKPHVGSVAVSANRHIRTYNTIADLVVEDEVEDYAGPLRGIISISGNISSTHCFVCPCDMNEFDGQVLERLLASYDGATPVYPLSDGQIQPIVMLAPTMKLSAIEHYLNSGGRSARGWHQQTGSIVIEMDDLAFCFKNVNTVSTLKT